MTDEFDIRLITGIILMKGDDSDYSISLMTMTDIKLMTVTD